MTVGDFDGEIVDGMDASDPRDGLGHVAVLCVGSRLHDLSDGTFVSNVWQVRYHCNLGVGTFWFR